jgi:hypothetical protein
VHPRVGAHRPTDDIDFREPGTQPEIARMMGSRPWDRSSADTESAVDADVERPGTMEGAHAQAGARPWESAEPAYPSSMKANLQGTADAGEQEPGDPEGADEEAAEIKRFNDDVEKRYPSKKARKRGR